MSTHQQCYVPQWNVLVCDSREVPCWDIGDILVPCWRLYWADQPGAWVTRRQRRWDLGADRAVMIAPYTRLESGTRKPCHHFWVHFTASPPYDFVSDWIGQLSLSATDTGEVRALAAGTQELDKTSPRFGTRLSALISRGMSAVPEDLLGAGRLEPRVDRALRLMRADLAMSVSDLAAAVHISPRTLNRLFGEVLGRSPKRVQGLLRLNQAELQLMYATDSIERIAANCGFHDRCHFSRDFSKAHGMGPASYRAQGLLGG
jgi:AraC-like DNA-binding protein